MKKLLVLLLVVSIGINAQQNEKSRYASFKLKEIALLNIVPNATTVILNLGTPELSGEKVEIIAVNSTKWVNFTSAIAKNSSTRNVSVKIEDGAIPKGLNLKLEIDNYTGKGKGHLGDINETITLSNRNQVIVSNIGGAYTGYGINNGYKLTYLLDITDYKLLNMNNSEVLTITFTLTDF